MFEEVAHKGAPSALLRDTSQFEVSCGSKLRDGRLFVYLDAA